MAPRISDAEALVMKVLWQRHPLTADQIVAEVGESQGWTAATVKTFLNRLLHKQAIAAEQDGKRYLYRPILLEADHLDSESQGLLDRFFDGRLAPLVAHFSQRDRLSPQDLAELRQLIEELDDGQ